MLALAAHILNHASDDVSRFGGQKLWHSFHKFINAIYSKFKLIFLVQKIVMPWITSFKYQTLEKYQVLFIPTGCDQVWSWNSNENIHYIWFCKGLGQTKDWREDVRRSLLRSVIIRCKNTWKILEGLPGQECTLLRYYLIKGAAISSFNLVSNIFELRTPRSRILSTAVILKVCSLTSSISISKELTRNTNSWAHPRPIESEILGVGSSNLFL